MKDNTQGQKDSGTGYKRGDPKWFERRKSKRTRSHDLICTKRPSHQSNRIPNPKKLFDGWFWWIHRELLAEMQPTDGGNWGISAPCGLWWRVGPGIYLEIFACATSVVRCGRRERRVQNLSRKNRRRHFATTNRPGWYRSCPGFYLSVSRTSR